MTPHARTPRLPDARLAGRTLLLGVGAQRAGTTWLSDRLAEHPEILMSPMKEMHWFDEVKGARVIVARKVERELERYRAGKPLTRAGSAYLHRMSLRDDADYLGYFGARVAEQHRVFGEFTPSYATLDQATFARMAAVHDRVKFLLSLRNPADRLWSQIRRSHKRQRTAMPEQVDAREVRRAAAFGLGDYRRTLHTLGAVTGPDSVCTLFYEDLFDPASTDAVMRSLHAFLGVRHQPLAADAMERVNAAPPRELDAQTRRLLVAELADTYRWAADHFGRLPSSWTDDLDLLEGSAR